MSTARSCPSSTRANSATEPARLPRGAVSRRGLAVVLIAAAVAASSREARAAIVEELVAKVNNRIITRTEFEERSAYLLKQVQQQHPGPGFDSDLKAAQDTLLANLITEALLLERANTIFDMDKIRGSLIDDFKKQQNMTTDEDLEKALKDQGMTRKDLEEQLIRMAVPNEIINYDVKRKISVSDAEMQDYYDAHRSRWETPAMVTLHEIVLLYTLDNRDEVRRRSEQIVKEAKSGTDFIELVKQYSEAGTREAQGLLGPLPKSDLQEDIAAVAFRLEPGQISEPIDTARSLHIIRLDARTDAKVKSLDEVKQEVHDAVHDDKFRPRFDIYLRKLWRENYIEITPKYEPYLVVSPLKPAPSAAPATTATTAPAPLAPAPPAGTPLAATPPDAAPPAAAPPAAAPPAASPPEPEPPPGS
jgi:peptidyl-prolyl cis-trans isomerase SurA